MSKQSFVEKLRQASEEHQKSLTAGIQWEVLERRMMTEAKEGKSRIQLNQDQLLEVSIKGLDDREVRKAVQLAIHNRFDGVHTQVIKHVLTIDWSKNRMVGGCECHCNEE